MEFRNKGLLKLGMAAVATLLATAALAQGSGFEYSYLCQPGCNNSNGCSYISNKLTTWFPHQECQKIPGRNQISCVDGAYVICYTQVSYAGYFGNCTGQVTQTTTVNTQQCIAITN